MKQISFGTFFESGLGIRTAYLILLVQIGLVVGVSENFYNPDYTDDIGHNEGRVNLNGLFDSSTSNLDNSEKDKRHFGAIAAHSGPKDRIQRQPSIGSELYKRHVGSAISGLRQLQPSLMMQKRYLGSVASKSGFRSPSSSLGRLSNSLVDSSLHEENKRHVGAFAKINSKPFNRVAKSFGEMSENEDSGESMDDRFFDYPVDITEIEQNERFLDDNDDSYNEGGFLDEPVAIKSKRFLGSLARTNWFPRNFRGIVSENAYDKRHIGSAARVGWLPFSKSDRFEDNGFSFGGEGPGFKRNIQSLRKGHFNAPALVAGRFRT